MAIAGTVIVLNGPIEGRQYAISQQLQQLLPIPFNALGLEVLQKEFISQPQRSKQELLSLKNSAYILGLNAAISGMARRGCNMIVDHTLLNHPDYDALRELLMGLDVVWIALRDNNKTPLYENIPYDLSIPTASFNDQEIARKIVDYLHDRPTKSIPSYRWAPDTLDIDSRYKRGALVVVYGTTSAGKTTISRALQRMAPEVFFHMGVNNTAVSILPRQYLGIFLNEGQMLEEFLPTEEERLGTYILPPYSHSNPTPYIRQQIGYFGRQTVSGIFSAIAMMCATGINVVSDQVFLFDDWYQEALHEFAGLPIVWVYVSPDLAEIERREKIAGDRIPGLALGHYHQMYKNIRPDIVLAENTASPEQNAQNIIMALREKKII